MENRGENMKKIKMNMVDIAVVVLLIVVAITIKMRFQKFNRSDDIASQMKAVQYTMKFSNVRQYTADAFEEGDLVFDKQTGVEIGKIVQKSQKANMMDVGLMDGTVVKSAVPGKSDLFLTIETDAIVNDNGYYANKTIELKVGSEKIVETLYVKSEGKILSIKTLEK